MSLTREVSDDEKRHVCRSLYEYNVEQTSSLLKRPGLDIDWVLKSEGGEVIGGIFCDTFLYSL